MELLKQLKIAGLVVLGLILIGTSGFYFIERISLLDALYVTVSTLTTLGTGETIMQPNNAGKIFTIIFALAGVSIIFTVVFWAISNAVEVAASDKLQRLLGRRRMDKLIRSVKDHYIICGYGRMGQSIANEFRTRKVPFVVVESNPEQLPRLATEKTLYVEGDASDEKILIAAGIEYAKGLIAVAPTDADNTFIVLTAKGMNPRLFVVARSIKSEDEPKLRRAGADRVMSPYILGGKRMAWAVLRPTVVDFLESALYSESLELEIIEVMTVDNSDYANTTIRDSRIREKSGATIIAVKSRGGTLMSSPSPDIEIRPGDTLIAVGTPNQLELLQNMAHS